MKPMTSAEFILFLILAVAGDMASIIPFAGNLIALIVFGILWLIFYLRGGVKNMHMTAAIGAMVEAVPLISILPMCIFFVVRTYLQSRSSHTIAVVAKSRQDREGRKTLRQSRAQKLTSPKTDAQKESPSAPVSAASAYTDTDQFDNKYGPAQGPYAQLNDSDENSQGSRKIRSARSRQNLDPSATESPQASGENPDNIQVGPRRDPRKDQYDNLGPFPEKDPIVTKWQEEDRRSQSSPKLKRPRKSPANG